MGLVSLVHKTAGAFLALGVRNLCFAVLPCLCSVPCAGSLVLQVAGGLLGTTRCGFEK